MLEIPRYYRSQFTDRFINYVRGTGEMMIQMELEFDSHLDAARLKKALELTLDAEPLLGCRLVKRWWRPRWERLAADGREALLIAGDVTAYEAFKHTGIDTYIGPQIKACLLRIGNGDRLLIKVAHEVADASAVKQIVAVISSIYSRLAREPQYCPEPNLNGDRSMWQVMHSLPWYAYPGLLYEYYRVNMLPLALSFKTASLPIVKDDDRTLEFKSRTIPAHVSQRIREYGRQRDGTINDIVLATYFHALVKVADWNGRSKLRLRATVDLRRFIPDGKAGGICNLSGMEIVGVGTDFNDDFDYTLRRISSFMQQRKEKWVGIIEYVGLAPATIFVPHEMMGKFIVFAAQTEIKIGRAPYVFTNMGIIEPEQVTFDVEPIDARFLPPVNYPPHVIFSLYSYKGALTLSAGTWPCSKVHIERCLDAMVEVLNRLPSEQAQAD